MNDAPSSPSSGSGESVQEVERGRYLGQTNKLHQAKRDRQSVDDRKSAMREAKRISQSNTVY